MHSLQARQRGGEGIWLPYGEDFTICPHLDHLDLPHHSQMELSSMSSFKVWEDIQELCHDVAYLLVHTGNTTKDRSYSVSLVWVNPNQARASTMEEVVETLSTYPSSGTNWPYALAQLYEGSSHVPLSKDKHLGILPQGEVEETSCGQISQLEVHQLISTGPQVVYPIGLNGHNEPIITTLPEPLSSCISIIASKDLYLGIGIPSPPMEGSECKASPIGEASPNMVPSPPKFPPKFKCSMAAEVNILLTQAMVDISGCKSKHSPLEKITMIAVIMSEALLQLVDNSSQASVEGAEASLEDFQPTFP